MRLEEITTGMLVIFVRSLRQSICYQFSFIDILFGAETQSSSFTVNRHLSSADIFALCLFPIFMGRREPYGNLVLLSALFLGEFIAIGSVSERASKAD